MHHGYFIRQISTFQALDPTVVLAPTAGLSDGAASFYPLGYNLMTAILHNATGISISRLMLIGTTVVAGILLPIAMFVMARLAFRFRPLVAGFAALATTLPFTLFWILEPGRIDTVISLALIPGVAIIFLFNRSRKTWRDLPLAALAVAGLIGVQVSEAVIPLMLTTAVVLCVAMQRRSFSRLWRWSIWVVGVLVIGIAPIIFLNHTILGAVSERSGALVVDISVAQMSLPNAIGWALTPGYDLGVIFGSQGTNPFYLAGLWASLVTLGCLLSFTRRWRGFLGFTLVYLIFLVMCIGLVSGHLGPFAFTVLPWYADNVRLSRNLTVLGAVLAAVALTAISRWLSLAIVLTLDWARQRFAKPHTALLRQRYTVPIVAGAVGCVIAIGGALAPVAPAAAILAARHASIVDSLSNTYKRMYSRGIECLTM